MSSVILITIFFSDASIFTQLEGCRSTRSDDEALRGSFLIDEIGQTYREQHGETDDVIRNTIYKWQMYNKMKCVHENAVNAILESLFVNFYSSQEHSLNSRSSNFVLENEAVLMAIEWKGLKQCNFTVRNHYYNIDSNDDDIVKHYRYPSLKRKYVIEKYGVDGKKVNDGTQENNFETIFLAEAVSAAIEVKGLTYERHS